MDAIQEAGVLKLPDMNEGTEYLYHSVYTKLARNLDVKFSDIDFDAFDQEDVDALNDLHSDVFENNYNTADRIASALRSVVPAHRAVAYV
jgi:hypothetical protein